MLYLLRSDFRTSAEHDALLKLIKDAGFEPARIIEIAVTQAPLPGIIAVQLRKEEHKNPALLVIGSVARETAENARISLCDLYELIPALALTPAVVLSRMSEWKNYDQVANGQSLVKHFMLDTTGGPIMFLPQTRNYYADQVEALRWHMRTGVGPGKRRRERGDGTREMFLDGRETGQMKAVPASIVPEAYPERGDEATGEQRVGEDRDTQLPPPPEPSKAPS